MSTSHVAQLTTGASGRRSTAGFWVAAAVALAGLTTAAGWGLLAAFSSAGSRQNLDRAEVPGTVTTQVTDPGTLVVYYEGDPVPTVDRLALRVAGPGGRQVATSPYDLDLRYDSPVMPGTIGAAVATFDARRSGTYQVDSPFIPHGEALLGVGDDVGRGFLQTLVGPAALAAASLLLTVVIALVTAVRINSRYRVSRPRTAA